MPLYSLLLTLVGLGWLVRWAIPMATKPKAREGLPERLGRVPPALKQLAANKKIIWLHAVSVGEVLAASRLVTDLTAALNPNDSDDFLVLISTTTATGQALAKQRFNPSNVFYMPLDFAFAVRPYLDALHPSALVLMESEVWPRMMHECRRRNIPVIVVNARVSDRSFHRSLKLRWLWSRVLRRATLWLAQSEEDARRLIAMGATPETVKVGGNLKYDVRAPKQSRIAELIKEVANGRPIIVAGSTVGTVPNEGEEQLVMNAWFRTREVCPTLLVAAPRHPERFPEAWITLASSHFLSATDLLEGTQPDQALDDYGMEPDRKPCLVEVILLNTIGDLAAVYGIADIAFVGGSLVPRGGHNPLEPAQFGVPVIVGSHYENFRDIVEKMKAHGAIRIVDNESSLESSLIQFLMDEKYARAMGERGRQVFESQQGATARAVTAILSLIDNKQARP